VSGRSFCVLFRHSTPSSPDFEPNREIGDVRTRVWFLSLVLNRFSRGGKSDGGPWAWPQSAYCPALAARVSLRHPNRTWPAWSSAGNGLRLDPKAAIYWGQNR
jgi:hypothetical protein